MVGCSVNVDLKDSKPTLSGKPRFKSIISNFSDSSSFNPLANLEVCVSSNSAISLVSTFSVLIHNHLHYPQLITL